MSAINYIEINKASWNKRTEVHFDSDFYDNESFIKGKNSLNSIELDLLGNIEGKSVLHLQCHFGQDTISLARLGANVVGVDLSDKAIEKANELNRGEGTNSKFICCDVYDLPNYLNDQFDIVFTSYGTIGWLPEINKWGSIVAQFLKPKGKFVIAEFHPVVWMFNDDFTAIKYPYLNSEPIIEVEEGTYAKKDADISYECVSWNHGLGEVINSLISNGLSIHRLNEYDYSPYDCFKGTTEFEEGKYRIEKLGDKIPMVYAIEATKTP